MTADITYYSPSEKGFYISSIHGANIPSDKIEIPDSLRVELLKNESEGKPIGLDSKGYPISITRTADEINLDLEKNVKAQRNYLLKESDWTQLPDVPQSMKDTWATYRQALRDITAQPGFPKTVNWPDKPSN